jgi:hypothetical protein
MAKILSKLSDLPIQKGILVHQEIEQFLRGIERSGKADPEASRRRLRTRFDVLLRGSRQHLREVRFRQLSSQEVQTRLEEAQESALKQLELFFTEHWPRYQDLEVVCLEKLEKFQLQNHPMWVSADLVVRDSQKNLLLVDWKTGIREHDAGDSMQLTGYILWARETFHKPLEEIQAELVWLASGRVDRTSRNEADAEAMLEVISRESQEMLALKDYAQITANPSPHGCRRCPFLPLCKEGSEGMEPALRKQVLAGLHQEVAEQGVRV